MIRPDADPKLKILQWHHAAPEGGHAGRDITLKIIKHLITWRGFTKEVRQYVRNCHTCQTAKYDVAAYPCLLQTLPIPNEVWVDIFMDFITGLPKISR